MTRLEQYVEQANEVVLGPLADLPVGEGRAYDVAGSPVAVFRTRGGGLYALGAVCTHAGGPIADGQADENVVVCPLHLNVFELATGCSRNDQPPLETYAVRVDPDGQIVVRLVAA
jgi:nitrite reductase/ring-hydroxylating ferredoxin subunit